MKTVKVKIIVSILFIIVFLPYIHYYIFSFLFCLSPSPYTKTRKVKANTYTIQVMLETYAVEWQGVYPQNIKELEIDAKKNHYWKDLVNPYDNTFNSFKDAKIHDIKTMGNNDFYIANVKAGNIVYITLKEKTVVIKEKDVKETNEVDFFSNNPKPIKIEKSKNVETYKLYATEKIWEENTGEMALNFLRGRVSYFSSIFGLFYIPYKEYNHEKINPSGQNSWLIKNNGNNLFLLSNE